MLAQLALPLSWADMLLPLSGRKHGRTATASCTTHLSLLADAKVALPNY